MLDILAGFVESDTDCTKHSALTKTPIDFAGRKSIVEFLGAFLGVGEFSQAVRHADSICVDQRKCRNLLASNFMANDVKRLFSGFVADEQESRTGGRLQLPDFLADIVTRVYRRPNASPGTTSTETQTDYGKVADNGVCLSKRAFTVQAWDTMMEWLPPMTALAQLELEGRFSAAAREHSRYFPS